MLTGKQKQYLKGTAVDFSAVVQIGKEGITDNVINSVTEALAARELSERTPAYRGGSFLLQREQHH